MAGNGKTFYRTGLYLTYEGSKLKAILIVVVFRFEFVSYL